MVCKALTNLLAKSVEHLETNTQRATESHNLYKIIGLYSFLLQICMPTKFIDSPYKYYNNISLFTLSGVAIYNKFCSKSERALITSSSLSLFYTK